MAAFAVAPSVAEQKGQGGKAGKGGQRILNVYNWSDYIAPDTLANFEKETGIKVRYDNFDNNEIVHAKLVAGRTGYDVVVPSSYWAKLQADGGLLSTIDDLHKWTRAILGRPELLQPNEPGGYAFGWYVGKRLDRTRYWHTGILPGMVSQIDLYPDTNTIVTNTQNPTTVPAVRVLMAPSLAYEGHHLRRERANGQVPARFTLAGRFRHSGGPPMASGRIGGADLPLRRHAAPLRHAIREVREPVVARISSPFASNRRGMPQMTVACKRKPSREPRRVVV